MGLAKLTPDGMTPIYTLANLHRGTLRIMREGFLGQMQVQR